MLFLQKKALTADTRSADPYERMKYRMKLRVLIADDSYEFRERLKSLIGQLGSIEIVGEAGDVGQAIEQVKSLNPDVIILDVRMPGGNGIEVLRQIRNERYSPLVIMLTSYPRAQYKRRCLEAGADFFFDKAEDFEKVVAVLGEGLRQETWCVEDVSARGEVEQW